MKAPKEKPKPDSAKIKPDSAKAKASPAPSRSPVLFVGAGPGSPELITVAGAKALMAADVVVTAGSLVNPAIIERWAPLAQVVDSAPLSLPEIVKTLIDSHLEGLKVVRLHTGDPSIYGAIEEQLSLLGRKGVPVKVIPGVTAAMAAAASLNLELTLPELTQTLIITRTEGRTPMPPGEDLESLCSHKSSLALYLSASQGKRVQKALCDAYGPDSAVAICQKVSWPGELIARVKAKDLATALKEAGIDRHALILAGPAVGAGGGSGKALAKSKLYDPGFSHSCRSASKESDSSGRAPKMPSSAKPAMKKPAPEKPAPKMTASGKAAAINPAAVQKGLAKKAPTKSS